MILKSFYILIKLSVAFSFLLPGAIYAAQLEDEDFEDQQYTDTFESGWTWNSNVSISSTYAHGGTYSLRMNDPGDGWPSVQWMLPRTVQEGDDYYVSYYQLFAPGWNWSLISTTNLKQFRARGSDGEPVWCYRKDGTTSRILYSFEGTGITGAPTLISGAYPTNGVWYRIEFYIKYSATSGEFWFKHNGNSIVSRTGINTMTFAAGPPTYFEMFGGNGAGQSGDWYIDDVEIWDSLPTGDTTSPTVTISTTSQTITTDSLAISGTAYDETALDYVKCRIGSAPDASNGTEMTGTTSWSGTLTGFAEGSNNVYCKSKDTSDNWSDSDIVAITYSPPDPGVSSATGFQATGILIR